MEARLSGTSLSENVMIHLGLSPNNNDSEILPHPSNQLPPDIHTEGVKV